MGSSMRFKSQAIGFIGMVSLINFQGDSYIYLLINPISVILLKE